MGKQAVDVKQRIEDNIIREENIYLRQSTSVSELPQTLVLMAEFPRVLTQGW